MNRVRRNVNQLSTEEVDLLELAFKGIMARDETEDLSVPIDENHPENISYFRLASFHGYITYHCYHHGLQFFHWHRKYMYLFEEALRSVPGCKNVTIPYLDITAEVDKIDFPDWLWERETFKSYTLPKKLLSVEPSFDYLDYKKLCGVESVNYNDGVTTRASKAEVVREIKKANYHEKADFSVRSLSGFQGIFDPFHAGGHNFIGGADGNMQSVPLASFDPIFWFHHSNVERWLWTWENMHGLNSSADYENDEVLPQSENRDEVLNGRFEDYFEVDEGELIKYLKEHNLDYNAFSGSVKEVLDRKIFKIPYEAQTITPSGAFRAFSLGAVEHGPISVAPKFSILVKQIDRSQISGSFHLVLTVNGVDHENFIFQLGPKCINCQKRRFITSLFILRELPITLSLRAFDVNGKPLNIGRPKINIRLPLDVAANNDNNNIINV